MADLKLVHPSKPEPLLIDAQEVADLLGVELSWVKNHSTRTKPLLPSVKLGTGRQAKRRYRKQEILQFVEDHSVRPSPALRRAA